MRWLQTGYIDSIYRLLIIRGSTRYRQAPAGRAPFARCSLASARTSRSPIFWRRHRLRLCADGRRSRRRGGPGITASAAASIAAGAATGPARSYTAPDAQACGLRARPASGAAGPAAGRAQPARRVRRPPGAPARRPQRRGARHPRLPSVRTGPRALGVVRVWRLAPTGQRTLHHERDRARQAGGVVRRVRVLRGRGLPRLRLEPPPPPLPPGAPVRRVTAPAGPKGGAG